MPANTCNTRGFPELRANLLPAIAALRLFAAFIFICSAPGWNAATLSAQAAASTSQSKAQAAPQPDTTKGANAEHGLLERIRALGVPSSTDRLTVYFDIGHEAKAVRLRALVQDALQFFSDSLGVSPELTLAVLERTAWERVITEQPYGIPGVAGTPPVAFLPATDDNLAAHDALAIAPGISDSARALVAASGHSWEDGSRRYVDLVGLHELGHVFAGAYGIRVKSKWFNEWLASYFCYTFLRAQRPLDAHLWEGILQGYVDAVEPNHRTLDAFEKLYFGVGARNYVWYQARFQQSIREVHDQLGLSALRSLRSAFPEGAESVESQAELLVRLERIAPGFAMWGASMR